MKTKFFILPLLIIGAIFFYGCNPVNPDKETNTFTLADCPKLAWAEPTKKPRPLGAGTFETQESPPAQLFDYDDSFGLRCFYYQKDGEQFTMPAEGGTVKGYFSYLYEMEIRRFKNKDDYYDFHFQNGIDYYCDDTYYETDARGFGVTLLNTLWPDNQHNFSYAEANRFQCLWKAQTSSTDREVSNSSALLNFTEYSQSVITLRIAKMVGHYNTFNVSYDLTSEELKARHSRIDQKIYNLPEFQKLPTEHEQEIMDHLFYVLDREIHRPETKTPK